MFGGHALVDDNTDVVSYFEQDEFLLFERKGLAFSIRRGARSALYLCVPVPSFLASSQSGKVVPLRILQALNVHY